MCMLKDLTYTQHCRHLDINTLNYFVMDLLPQVVLKSVISQILIGR